VYILHYEVVQADKQHHRQEGNWVNRNRFNSQSITNHSQVNYKLQ